MMIFDAVYNLVKEISFTKLSENPESFKSLIEYSSKLELLHFNGDTGCMEYENKQGKKVLEFGMCKNVFTLFPEEDYCDMTVGVTEKGHKYPCAVSVAWVGKQKLCIRVQSIDKHLGGLFIIASFKDDDVCIEMKSNTNCFFNEYSGLIWESFKKFSCNMQHLLSINYTISGGFKIFNLTCNTNT